MYDKAYFILLLRDHILLACLPFNRIGNGKHTLQTRFCKQYSLFLKIKKARTHRKLLNKDSAFSLLSLTREIIGSQTGGDPNRRTLAVRSMRLPSITDFLRQQSIRDSAILTFSPAPSPLSRSTIACPLTFALPSPEDNLYSDSQRWTSACMILTLPRIDIDILIFLVHL